MSGPLIAGIGILYGYIAFTQFKANNPGMGIAYAGYAFSQIGLWMVSSK